jgi:mannose-1-phosphate guanylyltransferase
VTLPPALVLTAGLGTRLFPLTLTRAKAAAPVAAVPLVSRILRWLADQGVRDAVLNLHHHAASVAAVVGDGGPLALRVRYSWESPTVLGSAGGPRHALPLLDAPRSLIVNGDTLTDVPLAELVDAHARREARVTLALVPNREPDRYGGVLLDASDAVVGFTRRGDRQPSWHFIGLQVTEADVFAPLQDGVFAESIAGFYRGLMRDQPGSVRGWRTDGEFVDIGTPADYLRTCEAFAAREGVAFPIVGRNCQVDPTATLDGSVLWDEVIVGPGARLARCVVADRTSIPPNTELAERALAPAGALQGPLPPGAAVERGLVIAPLDPYVELPPARRHP